ncbi:MAG: DUF4352 domain-containing protein [Halobacteriota archaeon]
MNPITATIVLFLVVVSLLVAGCTVILPESQNAPHNATTKVASSGNLTVSVQALGERQRYSVSQLISYSAKQGYKLAVYDVNITNLDGARQAGNTTFFTLTAGNGTTYQAALNTLSPRALGQGETLQGQVVFEIPQNATLKSLTYDDGTTKIVTTL